MFADARDSAGDLLGRLVDNRYKILEAMASGSMGAVFKAERVPVGKLVAIKFLHSSFANDAEFLSRFERETRVMSKLAHPNCVSVVDFGVWDGTPYLVMEYVNGQTLRAVLDAGPLQPLRALGIAKQIAAGLAHAHAQGIVHRDVKPANIMISEEIGTGEHVRILDFGLARLRGAVGSDATQTNVVVGTPNYMAPEQTVGGGTIDARTDVYAVGIVLFEMIAGERPFQADDTLALLGMHRAAPIPKLADRIDRTVTLPAGLQELIDTAMAKAPEDRFQSAIELAAAVDALTAHRPSVTGAIASARRTGTAPTVIDRTIERPTQRASRLPLVLLALLVLGGAAAGAWYLKQRRDTPTQPTTRPGAAALVLPDAAAVAEVTRDAPTVVEPAPDAAANELVVTNPVDLSESEPVPEEAANPAPQDPSKPAVDDEAEDAPKSDQEVESHVEKKVAAAPQLATTIREAVKLIQRNEDDLALASLRKIWKKTPNSAYVPFLLGNLYFDKRWWSVAMDHYKLAIQKNAGYKRNGTLIRNIIRTLGSVKTNKRAQAFLKRTIGRPALPYLRSAAAHDKNPHIKKWAAYMVRVVR